MVTVLVQRGVPQSGTVSEPDGVDRIARALESAAQDGEWDVVKRLLTLLESLKAGSTPDAKVIDLTSRRGKGGAQ